MEKELKRSERIRIIEHKLIGMVRIMSRDTRLEGATTEEILSWAYSTYGDRVAMSTAFGPSGVVLMHLASRLNPGARVFFVDTGFHFDETLEMVERIGRRLPVDIEVVQPRLSVEAQALVHGDRLFVVDPDSCCAMRKVEPTQRALAGLDAWLTALRRDQGPSRANTPVLDRRPQADGRVLAKIAPLATWTRKDVWRHIFTHELPYNPLHDAGYPSVGCRPCTQPATDSSDERAGRWSGRAKTECGLHTLI